MVIAADPALGGYIDRTIVSNNIPDKNIMQRGGDIEELHSDSRGPVLKRSCLAGDTLKLATGTASSHLLGILTAPIIARFFSPEAFGGLALLAAVSATITAVACLRYELAILLPDKDEDASHILWLCLLLVLGSTVLAALIIFFAGDSIWRLLKASALRPYAWLVPVNVFFAGVSLLLTAWNTRRGHFGRLMILEVVSRFLVAGSQILAALAGFVSAGALMATTVFGMVVPTVILTIQTWRESSQVLLAGLSRQPVIFAMRRYVRFPKYGAVAILLNSMSLHLPVFLLSAFISVATAGQYSFSNRLLRVPGRLIGTSFSQAFFLRAAEAKLNGTLGPSVEVAIGYLLKLSMFPCLLLGLIGKDLFLVAFGPRWAEAGVYSQILSPWLFAWFLASPLNSVFVVLEEQALELRFQIANFFVRGGSIVAGGLFGSGRLAIVLFSISGVLVYGSYCAAVINKSSMSPGKVLKPFLSSFAACLPASLIVLGVMHLSASPLAVLIVSSALLVTYFSILFRTDPGAQRLLHSWTARFRVSAVG
jgi:lipopolysaccharide exporter